MALLIFLRLFRVGTFLEAGNQGRIEFVEEVYMFEAEQEDVEGPTEVTILGSFVD